MKFSFTHKINLANIDRELWPYETEDISISDADSFEEAQKSVDRLVAERIGYYKAVSEAAKMKKLANPVSVQPSMPNFTTATPITPPPPAAITPSAPATAATTPAPAVPIKPQGNPTGMPPEFQVD
jgi:hypothetical protein